MAPGCHDGGSFKKAYSERLCDRLEYELLQQVKASMISPAKMASDIQRCRTLFPNDFTK